MKHLAHLTAAVLMWGLMLPAMRNNQPHAGRHRGYLIVRSFYTQADCEAQRMYRIRYWNNLAARGNADEAFWSDLFNASICKSYEHAADAGIQPQS
jgi:hypothetical protein